MLGRAEQVRVIDLSAVGAADRLAVLRRALRDLPAGGYLEFTSDDDPEELLGTLEHDWPTLRWTPMGTSGPPFTYAVFSPAPDTGDALVRFLTWQDELLDERLDSVDELAAEAPLAEAVPSARGFEEALAHHIDIEERLLFPLIKDLCPDPKTLARLREQHAMLRGLAREVTVALEAQDSRQLIHAMDALQSALSGHHAIEQALMDAAVR